jgi:hypothetical protein
MFKTDVIITLVDNLQYQSQFVDEDNITQGWGVGLGGWGHRGHDRMVVEFTTTCAISAYYHSCSEFESRSG